MGSVEGSPLRRVFEREWEEYNKDLTQAVRERNWFLATRQALPPGQEPFPPFDPTTDESSNCSLDRRNLEENSWKYVWVHNGADVGRQTSLISTLDGIVETQDSEEADAESEPETVIHTARDLSLSSDEVQDDQQPLAEKQRISASACPRSRLRSVALHSLAGGPTVIVTPPPDFKVSSESVNSCVTPSSAPPPTMSDSPSGGHDKPLVVGRTKPTESSITDDIAPTNVTDSSTVDATSATVSTSETSAPTTQSTTKKEKKPKQPKPQKQPAPSAPLSPALIDLRVGHILRCVPHENADSLYVSTIAMGDPEGAEFTQKDGETGKIVRTVCSGLNGLVPLAEMQNRKVIVVANLRPVTMRGIKSAAMVLAASPKAEEGADPHASDRVVELVMPPDGSSAGDKVYFEGWPYGEGTGPEKQLNPKKKQWEAIQPGFFTGEDLVVGFDASKSEGVDGGRGDLVVEGKGKCIVKTLKDAVVR